jgi:pimeloyl-ACP methyl ester carboxylesterase
MSTDNGFTEITNNVLYKFHLPVERKNGRAVLFVHGFNGDRFATWTAEEKDSFLVLIASDPDLADFDVFTFSYRTSLLAGDTVEQIARQLGDEIDGPLSDYRVILVAHSMGGLVCMRYILNRLERGHRLPILGLLMYGTPTTGTELVRIAEIMGFGLKVAIGWLGSILTFWLKSHQQVTQLGIASELLQRLHDQWALRVVNGGDPTEDANRRTWLPVRMVTGTTDWVVPECSAKGVYGEIDWHPIPYNHIDLVKPGIRTDTRYRLARQFFEKCRTSKDPEILSRLRSMSDSVWKAQEEKIIRDWDYEVEIHGGNTHPVNTILQQAGFAPCAVKQCQYTTVLQGRELLVGVSFGRIARERVWESRPIYVHQMIADLTGEDDRNRLARAVDEILAQRSPGDAWFVFFPTLLVSVSRGPKHHEFPLDAGKVHQIGTSLLKTYMLPPEAMETLGEEVTLHIRYESVVPQSLTSFNVMFPWLTHRCMVRVTIHGELEFLIVNRWLSRGQDVKDQSEIMQHKGEVLIKADDLVLPGSSAEIRWQRKTEERRT